MSEYQRYEFMTVDRPLTRAELDAVNHLSSHIEATSTQATIEYNWGDFKHDPIKVLRDYFDGFLYWANWGSPQLAFRFPHGILPSDLLDGYNFGDEVTFTEYEKYDVLALEFGELEAPDTWTNYDLGSLIAIREELMAGDTRALYVVWLASQRCESGDSYRYEEEYDEDDDDDEEEMNRHENNNTKKEDDGEVAIPPVPPAFGSLTAAQQALAELLQVPDELLAAAARHSGKAVASIKDDIDGWIKLLSPEQRDEYLVRLAHNEPGLSYLFIRELRELGQGKTEAKPPTGKQIPYTVLQAEGKELAAQWERERRKQEEAARRKRLQEIHDHQESYWLQAGTAATRKTSSGYDEATKLLVELREAATEFHEVQEFQARFQEWIPEYERSQAFTRRLHEHKFAWNRA